MGQWLVLTDIFVSTAHHAVHTHFLSEGVGVGVAEAPSKPIVPTLFFALVVIVMAYVVGSEPWAGQNKAHGNAILVMEAYWLGAKR